MTEDQMEDALSMMFDKDNVLVKSAFDCDEDGVIAGEMEEIKRGKLHTIGYRNWSSPTILVEDLVRRGIDMLFDVRYNPYGMGSWNIHYVRRICQEHDVAYLHVPELGNKNYRGNMGHDTVLSNPDEGGHIVADWLNSGGDCALMCCCKTLEECHRKDAVTAVIKVLGLKPDDRYANEEIVHSDKSETDHDQMHLFG